MKRFPETIYLLPETLSTELHALGKTKKRNTCTHLKSVGVHKMYHFYYFVFFSNLKKKLLVN